MDDRRPSAPCRETQRSPGAPAILDQLFDRNSLYALRAALEAHAARAGLPEGRTADLVLIVHELATNVVLHGSGTGRMVMRAENGVLYCHVTDPGITTTRSETPAWPYEPGHGLWIARSLSDRYAAGQSPAGTTVSVGFLLPLPGRPPFQLTRHDQNGHTTLRLAGHLDYDTAADVTAAVRTTFDGDKDRRLVLDLHGMTFWDSNGIAAIVVAQQHVNATPGAFMALAGLSGEFRHRLEALSIVTLSYDDPAE
ncbi:anti-anti-sigma factor [Nonomuraea solani]|uniref:Anti-anti-sigma factor n=1 Tax=Nonomuraea solani TaxID=1144553 RepID=A0A1H6DRY2_9ACTN|nr:ATP-binding protein [Nonomuraea solani]SEG87834.1 anti-anti-sigma factor [Nonomuraea solani]